MPRSKLMDIKNLPLKFVLLFGLIATCVAFVALQGFPLGIDLRGGHSLIYEISDDGQTPHDLSSRMIDILKDRVDPYGLVNLEWRPLGKTRFEVRMRAAAPKTRKAKEAYLRARERLLAANVEWRDISRLQEMAAELMPAMAPATGPAEALPAECLETIAELARGDETLAGALKELVLADVAVRRARAARDRAADENQRKRLGSEVELAEARLAKKAETVLSLQLTSSMLQSVLSNYVPPHEHDKLGRSALGSKELSAREELFQTRLTALGKRHASRIDQIEEVVELYKEWTLLRRELDDPADLKRMIAKAGVLEFRMAPFSPRSEFSQRHAGHPLALSEQEYQHYIDILGREDPEQLAKLSEPHLWFPIRKRSEEKFRGDVVVAEGPKGRKYVLLRNTKQTTILQAEAARSWHLVGARRSTDNMNRPCVAFSLDARGAQMMTNLTDDFRADRLGAGGGPMAILLDDEVYSAPSIQSTISAEGIITGDFSDREIDALVRTLTAGSLPAKLKPDPVSESSFGPALGEVNRRKGFRAAVWGLLGVAGFMLVYYLLAGALANVALLLNLVLVLGAMSMMNVVLTLPGIAGLILTVGIAVDANVLIFERLREEQMRGQSVRMTIKNAYQRAFSAIVDANLTTMITCLILAWIGTTEVRGFAITLMLGVLFSMFTALVVTRWLFQLLLNAGLLKRPLFMLRILGVPKINWMSKRHFFWGLSAAMMAVGIASLVWQKDDVLGIEFSSGTQAILEFRDDVTFEGKLLDDETVRRRFSDAAGKLGFDKLQATAKVERLYASDRGVDLAQTYDGKAGEAKDGRVSLAEWTAVGADAAYFQRFDADGSGLLDVNEIAAMPLATYQLATTEADPKRVREAAREAFGAGLAKRTRCSFVPAAAGTEAIGLKLAALAQVGERPWAWAKIGVGAWRPGMNTLLRDYAGGVLFMARNVSPAVSEDDLAERIGIIRQQPDFKDLAANRSQVQGLTVDGEHKDLFTSFAIAVRPGNRRDVEGDRIKNFAQREAGGLTAALERDEAVQIRSFDAALAGETAQRAVFAIVLSWMAIVGYLWFRFGSVQWGLAAVVCLIHDVVIVVGLVAVSGWLYGTRLGEALAIGSFKIDLVMVAAFLTVVGYSVNDTIVVFDRIRENRGKLTTVTPRVINASINQTLARTLLTSTTTLIVVVVMYAGGGAGIHAFSYALLVGVLFGTYSSVAVASPLLMGFKKAIIARTAGLELAE